MHRERTIHILFVSAFNINSRGFLLHIYGMAVCSGGRKHQNEDMKFYRRSCYPGRGASLWAGTCTVLRPLQAICESISAF